MVRNADVEVQWDNYFCCLMCLLRTGSTRNQRFVVVRIRYPVTVCIKFEFDSCRISVMLQRFHASYLLYLDFNLSFKEYCNLMSDSRRFLSVEDIVRYVQYCSIDIMFAVKKAGGAS